jgi:predicted RND superfamily exporter protein
MEDNRLVPYSVHLRKDIYDKLKIAAGERKASALVRDAITMLVEGDDAFNSGYNKGIRDAIEELYEDEAASRVSFDDETIADRLCERMEAMLIHQNVKGKKNGIEKA